MKYIIPLLLLLFASVGRTQTHEADVPTKASGPEIHAGDVPIKYDYQVPDQKITAPTSVDPGEVIIAGISPLTNPPPYLAASSYRWIVLENGKPKANIKEWPDGTSVLFGAGIMKPGEPKRVFTIVLSISYLYVVKDKDVITGIGQRSSMLTAEISVNGGAGPAPSPYPPTPGPAPNPNPGPTPDDKFGLTNKVYQIAMTTVPPASRAKGAAALTNSFNGIASSVAAGTLTDVKSLLTQSKTANQTALANAGVAAADWDGFFTALQKEIVPLYASNKLATVQDFADAWREISAGLDKVK